jgi:hypothetical protein
MKADVRGDPLVQAVLARFPGAEIVDVRLASDAATSSDEVTGNSPLDSDLPDEE